MTIEEHVDPAMLGERAELRRRKIVGSARKLFLENGFHATAVAQIAKESGIAVGQIYRDFASKEAIVATIVRADCIEYLDDNTLRRGIEIGDTAAIWVWLRGFFVPDEKDSEALFTEIVAETARNARIARIFETTRDTVRATILAALAALAPGDDLEPRRAMLADLILVISLGLIQHRRINPECVDAPIAEIALRLIQAEVAAMQLQCGRQANDIVA